MARRPATWSAILEHGRRAGQAQEELIRLRNLQGPELPPHLVRHGRAVEQGRVEQEHVEDSQPLQLDRLACCDQ